jgi:hypothetical protein
MYILNSLVFKKNSLHIKLFNQKYFFVQAPEPKAPEKSKAAPVKVCINK